MKRDLPAYVTKKRGRSKDYFYYERDGGRIPIKSKLFTAEFWAEYAILQRGKPTAPTKYTWRALVKSYRQSQRYAKLAPRTVKDYEKVLALLEERWGDLDPRKARRKDIIGVRDDNAEAVRFANYCVQVIRVLCEHAIDIGWIDRNPAKGILLLQGEKKDRKPWPKDMIERFREVAPPREKLIFELLLGTGQRIGDVLKMRWNDIEGDGINVRQNKTAQALWIPFTPTLRTCLDETRRTGIFIVAEHRGRPVSYRAVSQAVLAIRRRIGAEDYDIHALRHTTASELAEAGCSDELIQAITGHRSKASVVLYTKSTRQKARAVQAQEKRK